MGGAAVWDECGSGFAVINGKDFVVDSGYGCERIAVLLYDVTLCTSQ